VAVHPAAGAGDGPVGFLKSTRSQQDKTIINSQENPPVMNDLIPPAVIRNQDR
jgi:hypothetical protein